MFKNSAEFPNELDSPKPQLDLTFPRFCVFSESSPTSTRGMRYNRKLTWIISGVPRTVPAIYVGYRIINRIITNEQRGDARKAGRVLTPSRPIRFGFVASQQSELVIPGQEVVLSTDLLVSKRPRKRDTAFPSQVKRFRSRHRANLGEIACKAKGKQSNRKGKPVVQMPESPQYQETIYCQKLWTRFAREAGFIVFYHHYTLKVKKYLSLTDHFPKLIHSVFWSCDGTATSNPFF